MFNFSKIHAKFNRVSKTTPIFETQRILSIIFRVLFHKKKKKMKTNRQ